MEINLCTSEKEAMTMMKKWIRSKKMICSLAAVGVLVGLGWQFPGMTANAITYQEAFDLYDNRTAAYPKYLDDNPKIVLAYVIMGSGVYVDTTSVVCQVYNPPKYQLAINIITYNKDKGWRDYRTRYYRYDYDNGYIYCSPNDDGITWATRPIDLKRYHDYATQRAYTIAKITWKAAYNMDWPY